MFWAPRTEETLINWTESSGSEIPLWWLRTHDVWGAVEGIEVSEIEQKVILSVSKRRLWSGWSGALFVVMQQKDRTNDWGLQAEEFWAHSGKILKRSAFAQELCDYLGDNLGGYPWGLWDHGIIIESYNCLNWKGLLKVIQSNSPAVSRAPSARWGCSEPHPAWSWMSPGIEHPPYVGATCASALRSLLWKNNFFMFSVNLPSFSLKLFPIVLHHSSPCWMVCPLLYYSLPLDTERPLSYLLEDFSSSGWVAPAFSACPCRGGRIIDS